MFLIGSQIKYTENLLKKVADTVSIWQKRTFASVVPSSLSPEPVILDDSGFRLCIERKSAYGISVFP